MTDRNWLQLIQAERAIAVIRAPELALGYQMAQAVAAGGVRLIEITWNSAAAATLIEKLRADLPDCIIGTGTLLNQGQVQAAIAAGAEFLFTPHTDPALIQMAVEAAVPMIPGALSPSEIVLGWQAGASSIKVFPVGAMGGPAYIASLQGPLGSIPLIPTGGVTVENAHQFIQAGAVGVGLAGDLFPKQAIATQNWSAIAQRAQFLLQSLHC